MAAATRNTTPHHDAGRTMPGAFELLSPSWQAVKLNLITLLEFILVPIVLSLLAAIVFREHTTVTSYNPLTTFPPANKISYSAGYFWVNGVSLIISLIITPGMTYTLLQGARGKTVDFWPALNHGLRFIWRYIGVAICTAILVVIGFICFIVPGLFMLRRYYLAPYFLIDRDLGVFDTLRASAKESKQCSGAVFGVLGVQVLFGVIIIIPILGWIAGTILSIMYYNAPAIRYSQITERTKGSTATKAESTSPVSD